MGWDGIDWIGLNGNGLGWMDGWMDGLQKARPLFGLAILLRLKTLLACSNLDPVLYRQLQSSVGTTRPEPEVPDDRVLQGQLAPTSWLSCHVFRLCLIATFPE